MVGGGIAGLLTAWKLKDESVIVFDRKRELGKKCTGIISYNTFSKLGISSEFIDSYFKKIIFHYSNISFEVRTNIVRLNRLKLEKYLEENLKVKKSTDVKIENSNKLLANNEKYEGKIIDASGWKGKAKWIKAIEYLTEPIESDSIEVFFDPRNPAGFGWIVPLSYGTLVGSLSYYDPKLFIPKVNKRIIDIHGGSIPRAKPVYKYGIGDTLGLIKIFTGGGIFSIGEMLETIPKLVYENDNSLHLSKFNKLKNEINKQFRLTTILEKTWRVVLPLAFRVLKDKTLSVNEEFDFHSLLFRTRL
ncbi:TPA: NAD(P)/FAD-dependent oxidoreductase [Sulfurisphaera tokodaii]|uniref:NAD(P)/FAD-dependent oxidoreductase n=1 Tax=Sulfurisphaera tokodaii TaxID=111955 RepID=A0A832T1L7_9CREN|nr:NAD(P)/FAD-dependent oxidoreductase [Sulfurisphaera tokodaii]